MISEAARVAEELRRAGLQTPRSLTVSLTRACNLACAHCWVESPAQGAPVPPKDLGRVLDAFCALGGTQLCLTGGEPLLHSRWEDILGAACAEPRLAAVRLQTNGTLLLPEAVDVLRALHSGKLRLEVSLEGASAPTHDRVRGEGAFRRTFHGIKRLSAAGLGPRTTVSFTEMDHNLAELPDVLALAEQLGLVAVASAPLVRCGRARAANALQPPTPAAYRALVERYGRDRDFRRRADRLGRIAGLAWLRGLDRTRSEGCTFAENPYLTPDGTLYPCVLLHADAYAGQQAFTRGLFSSLREAIPRWAQARAISLRRLTELAACGDCSCRTWCAGGCMGRAWATHGKLLSAEDRCGLRQAAAACGHSKRGDAGWR